MCMSYARKTREKPPIYDGKLQLSFSKLFLFNLESQRDCNFGIGMYPPKLPDSSSILLYPLTTIQIFCESSIGSLYPGSRVSSWPGSGCVVVNFVVYLLLWRPKPHQNLLHHLHAHNQEIPVRWNSSPLSFSWRFLLYWWHRVAQGGWRERHYFNVTLRSPYEPEVVGLCVQSILVINKISNFQILKY